MAELITMECMFLTIIKTINNGMLAFFETEFYKLCEINEFSSNSRKILFDKDI